VREGAGRAARKRIQDEYRWQAIAENIESAYFEILGKPQAKQKENARISAVAVADDDSGLRRRAG